MGGGLLSAAGTKPPLVDVLKPQQPYPKELPLIVCTKNFAGKSFSSTPAANSPRGIPRTSSPTALSAASPLSRYIHANDDDEYHPLVEIMDELELLEAEAKETGAVLKSVLAKLQA